MGRQLNFSKLESKVLELLEYSSHGLTTTEIAKEVGVNRITMAKYLEMIQFTGAISRKKVGPANLWFIPREIMVVKNYVMDTIHPLIELTLRGEKTALGSIFQELQLMFFKISRMGLSVNGTANYIFYKIGEGISRDVLNKHLEGSSLREVLESAAPIFSKLKIGELDVVSVDAEHVVLNLRSEAPCSGMPVVNAPWCHVEAGLISGIINYKLKNTPVKKIKSHGLQEKLCQFDISINTLI